MLTITVPSREFWDEQKQEFVQTKERTLQLEHSLVSLSKWESTWEKAFLGKQEKTAEEILDYIRCMTITQNVDPLLYSCLSTDNLESINKYIDARMSATYFHDESSGRISRDTVTAELIYYWMVSLNIPFECQKWHLNRLLALIRVCNIKNSPPKKMSANEIRARNAAINARRKKELDTRG